MKIFLTGGSGFVGGAVIRAFKNEHQIVAMSRSEASDEKIRKLGAEVVRCDMENISAENVDNCDVVIHCAALVVENGSQAAFERINVEGTKLVLAAARDAGNKRFIHIGTESALFHGQHMRDVDETYPLALDSPFPYSRTKAWAEKAVLEASDPANGFQTISIRPRMIWGPGDESILPAVKSRMESGGFKWINGGKALTSTTHIENLLHAIELALTKGESGAAYFVLDDGAISLREFLTRYLATAGVDLGAKSIPGWLVHGMASLTEPIWRMAKISSPPPVTRFAASIMSRDCILNDAKARDELGYKPVISRDDGLAQLA